MRYAAREAAPGLAKLSTELGIPSIWLMRLNSRRPPRLDPDQIPKRPTAAANEGLSDVGNTCNGLLPQAGGLGAFPIAFRAVSSFQPGIVKEMDAAIL
jgi:hypothetical protein